MDNSAPTTLPSHNTNIDEKDIKFIEEHKLYLDNKNYVLKFGKIENNKIDVLIIFAKDEKFDRYMLLPKLLFYRKSSKSK